MRDVQGSDFGAEDAAAVRPERGGLLTPSTDKGAIRAASPLHQGATSEARAVAGVHAISVDVGDGGSALPPVMVAPQLEPAQPQQRSSVASSRDSGSDLDGSGLGRSESGSRSEGRHSLLPALPRALLGDGGGGDDDDEDLGEGDQASRFESGSGMVGSGRSFGDGEGPYRLSDEVPSGHCATICSSPKLLLIYLGGGLRYGAGMSIASFNPQYFAANFGTERLLVLYSFHATLSVIIMGTGAQLGSGEQWQ